jgi:Rps23 Pro-64 3,4-dihydroxylase Tpa1-like proline 4-hydroxylase
MKVAQRAKRFIVIDNFLDEATLSATRHMMERAAFTQRPSVISPADDGDAFRSKGVRFGEDLGSSNSGGRPTVYEELARRVHLERDFYIDDGLGWNTIAFTFWKYPAGSRLGWHNDAGLGRYGEFILFLHEIWRPSWGGELMLLDEDPEALGATGGGDDPVAQMEVILNQCPTNPVAIVPKPNRLVLVKAGTVHQIHRVDRTAGEHLRCTLTGFVSRDPNAEIGRQSAREKMVGVLTAGQDRAAASTTR